MNRAGLAATRSTLSMPALVTGAFGVVLAVATTIDLRITDAWFDDQRILALGALAFGLIAVLLHQRAARPNPGTAGLLVAVILLLGLLSAARAARPWVAVCDWAQYAAISSIVIMLAGPASRQLWRGAAVFAVAVAAAYSVGVAARYVSSVYVGAPLGVETLLVGFANPRFPAQLEALTVPFLPLAWRLASATNIRALISILAAVWWMCLFGSGSRTAWVALAVAAILLLASGHVGRRWVAWQTAAAAAGFALYAVLFSFLPDWVGWQTSIEGTRFAQTASADARFTLWKIAIDTASASPLLGVGPMHFAYVGNGEAAHPHNFWLQIAAEWGVPACALIVIGILVLLVRLWRDVRDQARDSEQGWFSACVLAAFTVWCVGTQTDGYAVVPTSQIASTVVLMLAVGFAPGSRTFSLQYLSAAYKVLALVVLTTLVILPFTAFGKPSAREAAWRAEHPNALLWPRFWQQGWIGPDEDPTARR